MSTPKRNNDIEILRAVAMFIIITHHYLPITKAIFPKYADFLSINNYWGMVDLFFCMSGFVVANNLLAIKQWSFKKDLIPFWYVRFWRLMPTDFFWFAVALFLSDASIYKNIIPVLAVFFQMQDVNLAYCWASNGYANPGINCNSNLQLWSMLGPYWSLSLEWKFYIILPIIMGILGRNKRIILFSIIVLAQLIMPREFRSYMYFLRSDAFFIGVILAHTYHHFPDIDAFLKNKLARSLLLPALMLWLIVSGDHSDNKLNPMVAIICGFIVYLASYNKDYLMPDCWFKRALAWIGSRSYSTYLIHMPLYVVITRYCDIHNPVLKLFIIFVLLYALSALNYKLIERPLYKWGKERIKQ